MIARRFLAASPGAGIYMSEMLSQTATLKNSDIQVTHLPVFPAESDQFHADASTSP